MMYKASTLHRNLILQVFFLFFISASTILAQTLTSLTAMGGSSQEMVRGVSSDENGNIYVLGQGAGTLSYNGIPTGYYNGSAFTYIFKIDSSNNLLWYKIFQYTNSLYTDAIKIAVDTASNVYITDKCHYGLYQPPYNFSGPYLTIKLDSLGNIVWAINSGGSFFSSKVKGILEYKGFYTPNDSLGGQKLTNEEGVIARYSLNGTYINHFQIDDPTYQQEIICGKDKIGNYFGYRTPLVNTTVTDKLELFQLDSAGNLLLNKIVHYAHQTDYLTSLVCDTSTGDFFYTCKLHDRTPLNSSTGTTASVQAIVKTDSVFNVLSVLKLGAQVNVAGAIQNIRLSIINNCLFLGGVINYSPGYNVWSCLGQPNYIFPVNCKIIFAKMTKNLNVLWHRSVPYIYSNPDIFAPLKHNSRILYFGKTFSVNLDGLTYASSGGDDIFLMDLVDDPNDAISITGRVFEDVDLNGIYSAVDKPVQHCMVVNSQDTTSLQFSSASGEFETPGILGMQYIKSMNVPLYWLRSTPDSLSINNTASDTIINNVNFGMYPMPGVVDVTTDIIPITPATPGFNVIYRVNVCNSGTAPAPVTLKIIQDSSLNFLSATLSPDSVVADSIYFNIGTLANDSCMHFFITDSLAANISLLGSFLHQLTIGNTQLSDTMPGNNISQLAHLITGSFDPNDITVFPGCDISESFVQNGKELFYLIRFQNTGTSNAINISVIDTLSSLLNLQDFEFVSASHAVQYSISNGVLHLNFQNIQLQPKQLNLLQSIGYFKFKVKAKQTVASGQQIKSTAWIFFDYNSPIVTNTAVTTVQNTADMVYLLSYDATCSNNGKVEFDNLCKEYKLQLKIDSGNVQTVLQNFIDTLFPGNYTFTFVSGYDTVIKLVTINYSPVSNTQQLLLCDGDSALVHGIYVSQSGNYIDTLVTSGGCDSLSIYQLQVQAINTTLTNSGTSLTANQTGNGESYQWLNCNTGYSIIAGINGVMFNAQSNGDYAVEITLNGCTDTSACYSVVTVETGFLKDVNQFIIMNQDQGILNIVFCEPNQTGVFEIRNIEGRLVRSQRFVNSSSLFTDFNVSDGVYFVCLQFDDGKMLTRKIVRH